eukprot:5532250-Amphidinium_carterae.1
MLVVLVFLVISVLFSLRWGTVGAVVVYYGKAVCCVAEASLRESTAAWAACMRHAKERRGAAGAPAFCGKQGVYPLKWFGAYPSNLVLVRASIQTLRHAVFVQTPLVDEACPPTHKQPQFV